jgi:predicted lipid-binding transport protein (Tim44 family)
VSRGLRHHVTRKRMVAALAVIATLAFAFSALAARPGGGQSFGGPSGGSRGGSAGGCLAVLELVIWLFELIGFLIDLHRESLPVALVVDVMLIAFGFYVYRGYKKGSKRGDWSVGANRSRGDAATFASPTTTTPARLTRSASVRDDLATRLMQRDPGFSLPLFEDFVYALYARAQEQRGARDVDPISAYVSSAAQAKLTTQSPDATAVHSIVVGGLHYVSTNVESSGAAHVQLAIEATYTERTNAGEQTYYVTEKWELARDAGVQSKPPVDARTFDCPSCGAPATGLRAGVCTHCNQVVGQGNFDWRVVGVSGLNRSPRAPQLTGDTEETGTSEATIVHPAAIARFQSIAAEDPAFAWDGFLRRVGLIFSTFQVAWSARDLSGVRGYLSDELYQTQLYWVQTYARERLRNITENARITRVELASVLRDAHYDSITIRVFATSLDYTVRDADGEVVSGSKSKPRAYSEYWTLLRGRGVHSKHTDPGPPVCPNCGAPLAINMSGNCTYCKVKVTTGKFDWVLSRIEQDEVYG